MNLLTVLQGANVALKVLQARLLAVLALFMTCGLYAWAMWQQSTLGAIIAATWGLTIFLPVLFTGRGGTDERERAERQPSRGTPDGTGDAETD